MQVLASDYDAETYGFNGSATSLAMAMRCNVTQGFPQSNTCHDVHLLPHTLFFPIGTPFIGYLFQQQQTKQTLEQLAHSERVMDQQLAASYGLHLSNSVTGNMTIHLQQPPQPNSNRNSSDVHHPHRQLFVHLAAAHCPVTLALGHQFPPS